MKRAWLFLIGFLLLMAPGAEARPQRIGETVPAIRLTSLSGKPVNTANLKGKTVVLYFWNDGCGCTEQLVSQAFPAVVLTGPRRSAFREAHPRQMEVGLHGDMMITGEAGHQAFNVISTLA